MTQDIRKIVCVYYATTLRGQPPRLFPRDDAAAAKEEVQSLGLIALFSERGWERQGQQSYYEGITREIWKVGGEGG